MPLPLRIRHTGERYRAAGRHRSQQRASVHYPVGDVVLQVRQVLESLLGVLDVRHSSPSSRPSRSRASAADTVSPRSRCSRLDGNISLADAYAVALARGRNATLIAGGDDDFDALPVDVDVERFRDHGV